MQGGFGLLHGGRSPTHPLVAESAQAWPAVDKRVRGARGDAQVDECAGEQFVGGGAVFGDRDVDGAGRGGQAVDAGVLQPRVLAGVGAGEVQQQLPGVVTEVQAHLVEGSARDLFAGERAEATT